VDYQKCPKLQLFFTFSIQFYTNSNEKKSEEKIALTLTLAFAFKKKVDLIYSRVEPEPQLHKDFYLEPEPHHNDAGLQHCSMLTFYCIVYGPVGFFYLYLL
jgi:hypothetical protein